ncbi:DUF937 domain-containing protein [Intrasporangium sp.]|uniref:DUF937 domain-containing protein n=1 Tax=Intrasporangium sp. TaxID=1925024 RepID=UPI00293B050B|nr:DUF937 domain-containing protein [Intrasporangium sp.]MDV3221262.1 DUF937 domain-containing protein [Intrasporangium sp.]
MSQYDEILGQVPVSQLAGEYGVPESEIREAAEKALPALLGGIQANAEDPAGATSLARALSQHQGGIPRDLGEVDVQDGQKIVGNIFGDNTDQVMTRLGGLGGGASGDLVKKLLPILAPIVLSWLAGKMSGQGGLGGVLGDLIGGGSGSAAGQTPSPAPGQADSGPLFPGGQGAQSNPTQAPTGAGTAPQQGSNPIQDVLGGILGGSGGGDLLGGILGGLLGGGRRS